MVLIPQAVVRVWSQNTAHWLEICHHVGLTAMTRFEEILWSEKFSLHSNGVSMSWADLKKGVDKGADATQSPRSLCDLTL